MPVSWTLKETEGEIRRAKDFADIAKIFAYLFGLSEDRLGEEVAEYERFKEMLLGIQQMESPSSLDLFDLRIAYSRASIPAREAILSSPESTKLLRQAQEVAYSAIKNDIENAGSAFKDQYLPHISEAISNIGEKRRELEKANTTVRNNNNEFSNWVSNTFQKMINSNNHYQDLKKEYGILSKQFSNPRFSEVISELNSIKSSLWKEINNEAEIKFQHHAKDKEVCKNLQDELTKKQDEIFHSVTEALASASHVSEEQAQAWVENNIYIAENAIKKLKRLNYPADTFKKDISTLYRYLGGKLGPIEFTLQQGSRRAFAKGKGTISIQGSFTKPVLFHECGHLAEAWDSAFQVACYQFVQERATGEPVSLKKLTGLGYHPSEKAYPDSFINPYVGKDYAGKASEVFSMALQCLSSPAELATLIEKDPQHFHLLLGFCQRQNPLLENQTQEALVQAKKRIQTESRLKVWEKALGKASGPAFGKRLNSDEGFHEYRISAWGRGGTLLRRKASETLQEGSIHRESWTSVHFGSVKELRHMAYLLIAHDMNLLPEHYGDLQNAVYQMKRILYSSTIPDWFDPKRGLPEVPA